MLSLGTIVDEVKATDADTGMNAEISYRIHSGGYDDFVVDNMTGVITVARKLDFDRRNFYVLNIVASDGGTPRFTSTSTLNISVINNNDKNPHFTPSTQRTQVKNFF